MSPASPLRAESAEAALAGEGPRPLGTWSAAALVVANMIGAGVFTTSGFALADLGRPATVLWAWAVGGVLATCGALSYAALARRMPLSGGEYTFLSRIFHPLAGFVAGWISLLAGFTAPIAAAALGLHAYLADAAGMALPRETVATGAIVLAGLLHGLDVRSGVTLQNVAVGLKLLLIAGFLALGAHALAAPAAGAAPAAPIASPSPSPAAFAVTLVWVSFAYSGWNAAVYVAGEIRDPERALPRALVAATALVTVLYLGLNAVFLHAAPPEALAGKAEIGAVAAEHLGGAGLRRAVSALVALALFTSISSMTMAGPRVYARMAADGLLPRALAPSGPVPAVAVASQAALAVAAVWITGLVELLGYAGFTLNLSSAATVLALLRLRRREGAEKVPVVGYPWVPGIFVLVSVATAALMAAREPGVAAAGLGTVALGVPLYAWIRRHGPASA